MRAPGRVLRGPQRGKEAGVTRRILFIGDSITDAGRRDDPDGLGRGYVRLLAERLRPAWSVVNRGIGGDRVCDLRARWDEDALSHAPDAVSIFVGINDTWRRYSHGETTTTEEFERDYRDLLDRLPRGTTLVLVEPYVLPVSADQREWGEDLDPKRQVVARLADEYGASLVPLHDDLAALALPATAEALAWDGVHPTAEGDRAIAESWLRHAVLR